MTGACQVSLNRLTLSQPLKAWMPESSPQGLGLRRVDVSKPVRALLFWPASIQLMRPRGAA